MQQSELSAKLEQFISQYANITQHSPEWHTARKLGVGGSQVASLMGLNPYSGIEEFIMDKVGLTTFGFKIATFWGTMFEPIAKAYTALKYNTTIIGDNIFIRNSETGNYYYSPDGFGVIQCDGMVDMDELPEEMRDLMTAEELATHKISLFEFKCPFNRIPRGAVPEYYMPQLQLGMHCAPLVADSVFSELVFRKCALGDLDFSCKFDNSLGQRIQSSAPIAIGYIIMRSSAARSDGTHSGAELATFLDKIGYSRTGIIDIGDDNGLFETFCGYVHRGDLNLEYSAIYYTEVPDVTIERGDDPVVAILPWKLFSARYQVIERIPGYFDNHSARIERILQCVQCIQAADNIRDAYRIELAKLYRDLQN